MNGLVKEGSLGAILFNSQIITEQDIKAALLVPAGSLTW